MGLLYDWINQINEKYAKEAGGQSIVVVIQQFRLEPGLEHALRNFANDWTNSANDITCHSMEMIRGRDSSWYEEYILYSKWGCTKENLENRRHEWLENVQSVFSPTRLFHYKCTISEQSVRLETKRGLTQADLKQYMI